MRISDWSSDVCSSDLQRISREPIIGAFAAMKVLVAPSQREAVEAIHGGGQPCRIDRAFPGEFVQSFRAQHIARFQPFGRRLARRRAGPALPLSISPDRKSVA